MTLCADCLGAYTAAIICDDCAARHTNQAAIQRTLDETALDMRRSESRSQAKRLQTIKERGTQGVGKPIAI
jgi:hypothetical protein